MPLTQLFAAASVTERCFIFGFAGALRVSELEWDFGSRDVTLHPQASVLIHGKGRKRTLPAALWKETATAVRAWLSVRGDVRVPELFLNARNDVMTPGRFRELHLEQARPYRRDSLFYALRSNEFHRMS